MKLLGNLILKYTLSQNMKVSSMFVNSVTPNLHCKLRLKDTLSQNIKVSSMLVASVTTKLEIPVILDHTLDQNMLRMLEISVTQRYKKKYFFIKFLVVVFQIFKSYIPMRIVNILVNLTFYTKYFPCLLECVATVCVILSPTLLLLSHSALLL